MLNGISVKQKPLEKIGTIFRSAGAVLANLEIPLTTAEKRTPNKSEEDVRKRNQFILKADPALAPAIAKAGIDLVSLGNNHCMDYRAEGLRQMEGALIKSRILFAGAGETREAALAPAVCVAADGRRIGLISALAFVGGRALGHCTPARSNKPGIATLNFGGVIDKRARSELEAMFAAAKAGCDVLIVGLHWGVERKTLPTSYQVALGRACIDAGADIVWGNHPHVLQGAEIYRGKPILYSMGNLISSKGSAAGAVKLIYMDGALARAQLLPLQISGGRVSPVTGKPGQAAVRSFANLCALLESKYPSPFSKPLIAVKKQPNRRSLSARS
ncbi:MAG TPA: CapA family protein [Fimbriimonadaceae bacterium]|nr:CapA family protein [Fimbriimonadaceae bacterium]